MSESLPTNLRYTKEHEWTRLEEDGSITIGVTQHAVEALGDITMVTLPEIDTEVESGESFGDIDSVKAVSELYAPVSGKVNAINESLEDEAEKVNDDCYGEGWLVKVQPSDAAQLDALMDAASYGKYIEDLD